MECLLRGTEQERRSLGDREVAGSGQGDTENVMMTTGGPGQREGVVFVLRAARSKRGGTEVNTAFPDKGQAARRPAVWSNCRGMGLSASPAYGVACLSKE